MFLFEYLVVELSVHVCEEITEVWKMNHLKELEEYSYKPDWKNPQGTQS